MLEDLNKRPPTDAQRDIVSRVPGRGAPMSDREVPIPAATPFDAMHRWLDGEGAEADAVRDPESERYVALWRRMGAVTAARDDVRAPADLSARIMGALPGAAPYVARADQPRLATASAAAMAPALVAEPSADWWQHPIEVSRGAAVAAAAGLVALGYVLSGLR